MKYLIVTLGLCLVGCSSAKNPFLEISFEQALAEAKQHEKLVFVDFYTTWCGPCKRLDRTTWRDAKVGAWLTEHTVPIKLDAEVHTQLAAKYGIRAYPTLMFIRANGMVKGKIEGYRSARQFLNEAPNLVAGKSALASLDKMAGQAAELDDEERLAYAEKLFWTGKKEKALAQLVLLYDKHDPAISGKPIPALLNSFADLCPHHPPAGAALRERRDRLTAKAQSELDNFAVVSSYATMNRILGDHDKNVTYYDLLRNHDPDSFQTKHVFGFAFDRLLAQQRYADIYQTIPIEDQIDAIFNQIAFLNHQVTGLGEAAGAAGFERSRKELIGQLGQFYQVLIGLGKGEEATALVARVDETDRNAHLYNALAWHGYLSGRAGPETLQLARRAHALSKGKDATMIGTLARILGETGHRSEGITLVEEALKTIPPGRDRTLLEKCLSDLNTSL